MNRSELAKAVAQRENLATKHVDEMVRSIFDQIELCLRRKESVTISGFGTFRVDLQHACTRRNPRTGETVDVPDRFKARFKASETLNASIH